ncbi:MAG: HAMP domain-containing sensor histidine kinase [Tenuifilaceae bacterium]|jgi:signal transduction histidine kinase|nr:HAMP domain-containing sensor histidine kinase [Tenuifilaceae bacterium]
MASLGVLTAGVAHEINNPINYIYNGAKAIENFLVDKSPENLETLKPLFEAISTGIHRITGIVKSLNKYSRKDESALVNCNLNEILDNALAILYNQFKKRIEINKEYSDTPPVTMAKEGELHQVLLNILINAIQSIENEGTITLKTQTSDNGISVSIKDSGIGIPAKYLSKIFDPFFTTKDPGKGTGLGLSITKRIIQEHKGTINCYSEPNKGSEFVITLPLTQEE